MQKRMMTANSLRISFLRLLLLDDMPCSSGQLLVKPNKEMWNLIETQNKASVAENSNRGWGDRASFITTSGQNILPDTFSYRCLPEGELTGDFAPAATTNRK